MSQPPAKRILNRGEKMKFNSLPVDAPLRITSKFGRRSTGIENASTFHKGIDLGRDFSKPKTKILAVKSGVISKNYWSDYRGWVVVVKHDDVYSTLYQHMRGPCPLPVGTRVRAGDELAVMGNSSNPKVLKVAIHLHFELHKGGQPIDPLPYLMNIDKDEVLDLTEAELKVLVRNTVKEILSGNGAKAPSQWAKETWEEATADGIVDGSGPKAYPTREQVVQMIRNAMK